MEPEQERLSKLYSGSGIHSLPELNPKLNPKSPSYLKPMIHRSASFPQIQHGGQCTADILFRTMNGFFQGVSFCNIGGDCAG